jgi:hypothetical protein
VGKSTGGTHASLWFPRISGITPNSTPRGPSSSPAKQPDRQGSHVTDRWGPEATDAPVYWRILPIVGSVVTRDPSQSFEILRSRS